MALYSASASCPACGTLVTCVSDEENATTVSGNCPHPTCGRAMTLALTPAGLPGTGVPGGIKPGFHHGMVTDPLPTPVDPALIDESASHGGVVEYGSQAVLPDVPTAAPAPGSFGVPVDANAAAYPAGTGDTNPFDQGVEPTPSGAHPASEAATLDAQPATWTDPAATSYFDATSADARAPLSDDTPRSTETSAEH